MANCTTQPAESWSSGERAESFLSAQQSIDEPVELTKSYADNNNYNDNNNDNNNNNNAGLAITEESADIADCSPPFDEDELPPPLPDRSRRPCGNGGLADVRPIQSLINDEVPDDTQPLMRARWKQFREDFRRLAKSAKETLSLSQQQQQHQHQKHQHQRQSNTNHNYSVSQPSNNRRISRSACPQFGVDLRQSKLIEGLPLVVADTTDYLTTKCLDVVGLFRIPGSTSEVRRLKELYDSGQPVDLYESDVDSSIIRAGKEHNGSLFTEDDLVNNMNNNNNNNNNMNNNNIGDEDNKILFKTPHSVAALLKLYLRELPEPLLTFDLYDCFIAADSVPVPEGRRESVKRVLKMLPQLNLRLLMHLVIFLRAVEHQSAVNKMNASNLAMVFAPNLLRPRSGDLSVFVGDSPHAVRILETLITDFDYLFNDVEFDNNFDWRPPQSEVERSKVVGVEKMDLWQRVNEKVKQKLSMRPNDGGDDAIILASVRPRNLQRRQ